MQPHGANQMALSPMWDRHYSTLGTPLRLQIFSVSNGCIAVEGPAQVESLEHQPLKRREFMTGCRPMLHAKLLGH